MFGVLRWKKNCSIKITQDTERDTILYCKAKLKKEKISSTQGCIRLMVVRELKQGGKLYFVREAQHVVWSSHNINPRLCPFSITSTTAWGSESSEICWRLLSSMSLTRVGGHAWGQKWSCHVWLVSAGQSTSWKGAKRQAKYRITHWARWVWFLKPWVKPHKCVISDVTVAPNITLFFFSSIAKWEE